MKDELRVEILAGFQPLQKRVADLEAQLSSLLDLVERQAEQLKKLKSSQPTALKTVQSQPTTPSKIAFEDLEFGDELGDGATSQVVSGFYRGEPVAIKGKR